MTKSMITTMTASTAGHTYPRTYTPQSASSSLSSSSSRIMPEVQAPQKRTASKHHARSSRKASRKSIPAGFWMALFSWIIAIIIMSGSLNEAFSLAEDKPQLLEVQVEKGDTLWGIAQELNNTVFNHEYDLRHLIYAIEEANGLENAIIHPGQNLVIPLDL